MSSAFSYTITEVIRDDAITAVYRGTRREDQRPVVIKVLGPARQRPGDIKRLEREYELGLRSNAPGVVRPVALDTFNGRPALIMEDFGGRSLDSLIGGPMETGRFLDIAVPLAAALVGVHAQGIVHKDIKPQNVIVNTDTGEVKIADLGIASLLPREQQAVQPARRVEGSLPYMSPEQTGRMNRAVDSRTDLYSLGVTFYQMLTDQLPFEANDPLEWMHCHIARPPKPPSEIVPRLDDMLSRIVLKLLFKMAEDRYQTARGLQHDLERCLARWRAPGRIDPFPLGEHDVPDQLQIPQKLYGREPEIAALLAAFDRVVERGAPEILLVSGHPGVGKSVLVHELHKPILRERGIFISGKFDQYKREIPYSTIVEAFQGLVLGLLTESEERIDAWRREIQAALGINGQLIITMIPQLELILGKQPAVPELPLVEAQNRFHMVFRRFIGVFASRGRSLALFLDDLQWADSPSLNLLQELIIQPDTRHLLLIGAYRANEVDPAHPLMLMLQRIRSASVPVSDVVLLPLRMEHLARLVADTVRSDPERALPLAALVHDKTGGNPFFAIQFLTTLYHERLLELDEERSTWRWEIARIEEKSYTDNVVDFMVRRLTALPVAAQDILETAACIGNRAPAAILALAHGQSEEATFRDLWEAIREGLILLRSGDMYTFAHDRVQQAAYSLVPEDRRSELHLRIGRILLAHTPTERRDEHIFEIVSQLNAGVALIRDPIEREQLVRLNFIAGRRARASIAYMPARSFFSVATNLLPEDTWESQHDFSFRLLLDRAECEYLSGGFEQAEALFDLLLDHARTSVEKATVYELRLKLFSVAGKHDEAVAMGLKALRLFGVEIPDDDDVLREATRAEAEAIKVNLGDRTIADIERGPEATDPAVKAVIGLLSNITPAAYIGSRPQLFPIIILKLVNYSLEFGNTEESCMGYSAYGLLLVSHFEDPRSAYEFSEMSIKLNQRLGDISRRGTVLHLHGDHINFWLHHIATDFPILERGFLACLDAGDLVFANYIAFESVWQAVERGDMLDDVLELSNQYAEFARKSRNEAVYWTIRLEQQFIECLKGQTRGSADFGDESFEEAPCLERIAGATFTCGIVFYHGMKLIAAFLSGDESKALIHAGEAKKTLSAAMAMPMEATYYFFHALALAGVHAQATGDRPAIRRTLGEYSRKLGFWAQHCPENFLVKHALVSAEIARLDGDELRAERLYEQAIEAARENRFIHWRGIASELASRFYRRRGFEAIGDVYLREARACYVRWGADGKVRQLDERHPRLREASPIVPAATVAFRAEQIDLLSVVKASQTISGEIILDKLVCTLLQVVLEQSGGQEGYLIFVRGADLTIEARATFGEDGVVTTILPPLPVASSTLLPASIVQYVRRTKEGVILDDAADATKFSSDPIIARRRPRSVLCLPIVRQGQVVALLYLENNLAVGAFTADRLAVLELLASQAAISLDSAQLLSKEQAGRAAAEEAERRSSFLAQVSPLLAEESLDYEQVFAQLSRLVVRFLADWCVVDLLENGQIRRLTGAHRDASRERLLEELRRRFPPRWDTSHPAVEVLRRGEPLLLVDLTDEDVRRMCVDEEHFKLLLALGTRSALIVPLIARGQTLGALTMALTTEGRRYGPMDLELARELAHRAALAIDNARLYRDAQQAIQLRDDFLSVASHELNTPLTSLMLSLQGLLQVPAERRLEPATVDGFFQLMARQGSRLTRLVSELLDVSRIQADLLPFRFEEGVDLVEVVQEVVARSRPNLERAACSVLVRGPARALGRWDRSRLEQVVTNLLSNAIKFGARKPIEITIDEDASSAGFSVTDHGMGIELSQQGRLFERFARGVSADHYGGLGLGLYISRCIVAKHGGSIQAASQPGAGATFTVEIPRALPAETRA